MGKYHKLYNILKCKIDIPINDYDAWLRHPDHRWVYNRMELSEFQMIKFGPMPLEPPRKCYPVIIKPITNLYGMGKGIIKINNEADFYSEYGNTDFWMEFFEGEHISHDFIILDGKVQYKLAFKGYKDDKITGKFDHWESIDLDKIKTPHIINKLIDNFFKKYTGCLNIETIGDKIIECHLRMGDIDQFPTLELLNGVIETYAGNTFDWSIIILGKVFFVPVWSNGDPDLELYTYLKKIISPLLEKNIYICDYDIDKYGLASPCDDKRLLWFTCCNFERGNIIRHQIYHIVSKFEKDRVIQHHFKDKCITK
jgi:hypothetical protein